jgi:hypothetical protein
MTHTEKKLHTGFILPLISFQMALSMVIEQASVIVNHENARMLMFSLS